MCEYKTVQKVQKQNKKVQKRYCAKVQIKKLLKWYNLEQ